MCGAQAHWANHASWGVVAKRGGHHTMNTSRTPSHLEHVRGFVVVLAGRRHIDAQDDLAPAVQRIPAVGEDNQISEGNAGQAAYFGRVDKMQHSTNACISPGVPNPLLA